MRVYAGDWRRFAAWMRGSGRHSPPRSAGCRGRLSLLHEADNGVKAATITRRAAAIGYMHEIERLASPTADPAVKAVLGGIRDGYRSAPGRSRKPSATAGRLRDMLAHCGP